MKAVTSVILVLLFVAPRHSAAQSDTLSPVVNKKRLRTVVIVSGVTYATALAGLHQLWYKDTNRQSFQFFNDNKEWKQMDKIGHVFSSFHLAHGFSRTLQWCDVPVAKADLAGSLAGFLVLVPVEIFDGFSEAYGASAGDLIADAAGPLLYLGQKALWHEVRIHPKFSFHQTRYAPMRPDLLGDNLASEVLKDYNGQTYWLSVDVDKFIQFPRWLNIAVGYGAEEMITAHDSNTNGLAPYRQYYLSLDIDLTAIRTRSKFLKTVIFVANMIKVPSPTVSFSKEGTRWHLLYF